MQLYVAELIAHLDRVRPNWRKTHIILLDNMRSHKTQITKRLFEALEVPYMFTAPASFMATPVESVFKYLKLTDFREMRLLQHVRVRGVKHDQLTPNQYLLAQVSDYLLCIT